MSIVRWDPFKDLVALQERMNRLFEDTLSRSHISEEGSSPGVWSPVVDIYETEREIILKAELPGIERDQIHLEAKENTLTLKGERRFEKEVKEETLQRIERSYGKFQRTFTLPTRIDEKKVKAKYQDGVLEIRLPKSEADTARKIAIE